MVAKSLFLLVVVGLCASQMAYAHREARGVADFFNTAKNKLAELLGNAEDSTLSSINTVKEYINKLEYEVLESGTEALNKAGLQVDLNDLAALVKGNLKDCTSNEKVKEEAKEILNDMASCVTKDVSTLKELVTEMEDLWDTARDMPNAIKDVAAHCNSDDDVEEEPIELTITLEDSDHELAEASNALLQDASKHLSKRAAWDLSRMTRCVKTVFDFAKKDLVNIPGEIITAATHAFQVVKGVQGGIPECVAKKAVTNSDEIAKLSLEVGACVAAGVANGDLSSNESLSALKKLASVAETMNNIQKSGALDAAGTVTNLIAKA